MTSLPRNSNRTNFLIRYSVAALSLHEESVERAIGFARKKYTTARLNVIFRLIVQINSPLLKIIYKENYKQNAKGLVLIAK